MSQDATLGVKLDAQTRARLKALGETKDRSVHWLVREAVAEYVVRQERFQEELREDNERWEHYQATCIAHSHETVVPWLRDLANGQTSKWPK